jgi:fumarate reductase flavoprotein subunit
VEANDYADVVVVGGGGAGPAAAIAAQEAGANSVLLIEERDKPGGNAVFATGLYACGSQVQRDSMVDINADAVFATAMEWHHHERVDPRIMRAILNQSGDTIAWLTSKTGIEFMVGAEFKMSYEHMPTWHLPARTDAHGARNYLKFSHVHRALINTFAGSGGQTWTNAKATALTISPAGAVTGVRVVRGDGTEVTVGARAVVLATGGFHGNPELLRRYFYYDAGSLPGYRVPMAGDGIALAASAGALIDPYATLIKETCHSSDVPNESALGPAAREPYVVWVNRLGRRFTSEAVGIHLQTGANPLLRQPDMTGFALLDDAMVEDVEANGWLLPRAPLRPVTLRKHLKTADEKREWAITSGDWEEIAGWIGAPPDELRGTVAEYNRFCAHGYDSDFAKDRRWLRPLADPPFHAIRFGPMIIDTAGPVRVDERMRCLGTDYLPVPGLYAAGSLASGWLGTDYCGQHLFGMALGFAVNSGRIAGREAARA